VEATTLEDAAASLLVDAPEETGGNDNLDDAVDAITEPTGDDQSEVDDEAEEDQDDVEVSDEDYDDQIDDEDQVEAAEETNLIPVKVNGKEEMWTLDQLKQSAAGQGYINQRMQEIAQVEKQYKEQAQALAQQQQQVLQLYQQAQQGGLRPPTPPSKELFNSDPIGYMEQKIQYDEAVAQYNQKVSQLRQVQQQQTQAQQAAQQEYLQQQAEVLRQHIPEIADPEKGAQIKNALVETGVAYGFSPEEMMSVSDARYVRALHDAMKYRRLQENKRKAMQKGEKAMPMAKAGAKKRQDGQAATRKKAQQRLQKTGSIDDALSLMFKS
jgi:hypothetical protein